MSKAFQIKHNHQCYKKFQLKNIMLYTGATKNFELHEKIILL